MFSFRPTVNFEFGFQRTIIFGGEAHAPVTLHTFLKGFFDPNDTTSAVKFSRDDPGHGSVSSIFPIVFPSFVSMRRFTLTRWRMTT